MKKPFLKSLAIISVSSIAAIGFSGCSQEDVAMDTSRETNVIACSPIKIPLSEAMGNAERVMRLKKKKKGTRTRTLEKVEYIATQGTRSGDADTLFYVVNYSGNNGFAVLSADRRLPEVYAISDEGHLDMNDTVENKGLAVFFSSLPTLPPIGVDTIITEPINPPAPDVVDNSYRIGPLLDSRVRRWHQDSPFNSGCPLLPTSNSRLQRARVGCVPLAVGMIMSFYEWPISHDGTIFNWNHMKNVDPTLSLDLLGSLPSLQRPLSILLASLGDKDNLWCNYGLKATSTFLGGDHENIRNTFENFGYRRPSNFRNFSNNSMKEVIDQNRPALIYGFNHMWIVDALIFDDDVDYKKPGEMTYWKNGAGLMLHLVWGWNSDCNGYFRFDNGFERLKNFYDVDDPEWQEFWNEKIEPYKTLYFSGDFEPLK